MVGETNLNETAPPWRELWAELSRAYAAIECKAAEDLARHGLTLTEFGVLQIVYHRGPVAMGEIQRQLLVSSGGITYLVDRLERKGTIKRRQSAEDRRLRYLELTPKGRQVIHEVSPQHARRLGQVLSGLTPREQGRAAALLRRLGFHAARV
ncbi:MAG: MarR family transcriptional regulator [Gemmatimonadota bacterium]|nr:MAG: MarR family transcriptional regulator [Gemmatimonadota bacterium]